ncbi:hypothetical protein AVEN_225804-1 [Araneus ventricosus]|uniref:Uncharacterized protein n=1 Tax=Araneus ventricosus TaxID=182803 RepID=A0A4Y2BAL8_ARAVE|nr:hypothetical protein AVEN_225804-1 [Araneus ventricosus]
MANFFKVPLAIGVLKWINFLCHLRNSTAVMTISLSLSLKTREFQTLDALYQRSAVHIKSFGDKCHLAGVEWKFKDRDNNTNAPSFPDQDSKLQGSSQNRLQETLM